MELTKNELQMMLDAAVLRGMEMGGKQFVSANEGRAIWGTWFSDAVKRGRLRPVRGESDAPNAKKFFQRSEVLTLLATDKMAARVQLENNN